MKKLLFKYTKKMLRQDNRVKEKPFKGHLRTIIIFIFIFLLIASIPIFLVLIETFPFSLNYVANIWKESILMYSASLFTVIATCTLGILTYWHSLKMDKENKKWKSANIKRPFLVIENVYDDPSHSNPFKHTHNKYCLNKDVDSTVKEIIYIVIKNVGDGPAINIDIPSTYFSDDPSNKFYQNNLMAGEVITIPFILAFGSDKKTLNIYYNNLMGFNFSQEFSINYSFNMHNQNDEHDGTTFNIEISNLSTQNEESGE